MSFKCGDLTNSSEEDSESSRRKRRKKGKKEKKDKSLKVKKKKKSKSKDKDKKKKKKSEGKEKGKGPVQLSKVRAEQIADWASHIYHKREAQSANSCVKVGLQQYIQEATV